MASRIGVIIGSTREPRVGPQIADFIVSTIGTGTIIDLKQWNLPMYDEPGIPKRIHDHNEYKHEHTRAWSVEIQKYDAFVFVTPQYNWGYPAALKNAIDFLFNEWKGKPAMVVSYGGHGGSKCNAQLREVLTGIDMTVTKGVELTFTKDNLIKAATGKEIDISSWKSEKKHILAAYDELVKLMSAIPIVGQR